MRRPVNSPYNITTEFGVADSYAKFGRHSGIDYAVPLNRPVYAPISGSLTNIVSSTGGNMVVIKDDQGLYHRLMHNSSFSRGNGRVNEGEEVSKAGTTGLSTGVHVHWDINREGSTPTSFNSFVSPSEWLEGKFNQQGEPVMNEGDIINMYRALLGREPDPSAFNGVGKPWKDNIYGIINSPEFNSRKQGFEGLQNQVNSLRTALQNEQNKPPKEVIKEVEKIVEKEVVKEVPVYTHDAETKNMVKSIYDYFVGQFKTFQKYIKK